MVAAVSLPGGSSMSVRLNAYEYDQELVLGSLENTSGVLEDYSLMLPARVKAGSAEMEFNNTGPGRMTIRTAQADISGARPSMDTRTKL